MPPCQTIRRRLLLILLLAVVGHAEESGHVGELIRESFDAATLDSRGWYDGKDPRIVPGGVRGNCIEYEWTDTSGAVTGSSAKRHLFEPADEIFIRYYLRLSKGWGWSGRNYHPHLTHFTTTENTKWHGPAASHLTLCIEPVNAKLRLAAQDIQNKDSPHGRICQAHEEARPGKRKP